MAAANSWGARTDPIMGHLTLLISCALSNLGAILCLLAIVIEIRKAHPLAILLHNLMVFCLLTPS